MVLKIKYKFLIIMVSIFILVLITLPVEAFSNTLKSFVSNDKMVYLKILENFNQLKILTGTDAKLKNLDGSKSISLKNNKEYIIVPDLKRSTSWFIQVFASSQKEKAEQIKKEVKNIVYDYNIRINYEDNLYKVQVGNFITKSSADKISKKIKDAGWESWIKKANINSNYNSLIVKDDDGNTVFKEGTIFYDGTIRIKDNLYNGLIEFKLSEGEIDVYNRIDFLTLQYGMLLNEIPDSNNMTSLKAGAILNRSKALNTILTESSPYVFEEYKGISQLTEIIKVAVNSTEAKTIYKDDLPYYKKIYVKELGTLYSSAEELILNNIDSIEIRDLNKVFEEKELVNAKIDIGLKYREIRQLTWDGPRIITIVDLDSFFDRHTVFTFISEDQIPGLSSLAEVVKQKDALVGINGGFYSYNGKPLGAVMIDGTMVSEPMYNRTALGITKTGEVLIDNLSWKGILKTDPNSNIIIDAVNREPDKKGEIILYNAFFTQKTPQFEQESLEIVIENNEIIKVEKGTNIQNEIPKNGFIIKIFDCLNQFEDFQKGKKVEYNDVFKPEWHKKGVINIMGGGPKLISEGKVNITSEIEKFNEDIIKGRAPRTAVGITEDNHLLFIAVDGRQPDLSIGMTLEELAQYLKDSGIKRAMNLDGGASSQLVIRGYTFNNPSSYRDIATGILIKKK